MCMCTDRTHLLVLAKYASFPLQKGQKGVNQKPQKKCVISVTDSIEYSTLKNEAIIMEAK